MKTKSSWPLQVLPIHALKDNYIWMITDGSLAWIVDPGEAPPVLHYLQQSQIRLQGILVTHHHHDHTGGIKELIADHEVEVLALHSSRVPGVTRYLQDEETFQFLGMDFQALSIPGHTLDHTAYYAQELQVLFSGDTLFSAGCGRIFEGNPTMMFHSLQKLATLPEETKIYCGHEYTLNNLRFAQVVEADNTLIGETIAALKGRSCTLPSTLKTEKALNPFLRAGLRPVYEAAERHCGHQLRNPEEVFAHLREWKNHFV